MHTDQITFPSLTLKTVVVHTVTYFVVGLLAFVLLRYDRLFTEPTLFAYMRPTDDMWVMAGPLFQPIRGALFATVFYPLRKHLFGQRQGWLVMWWLLVAVGILSTFGPSPGSLEGIIYTQVPLRAQLAGLPEVIVQSLLLSVLLFVRVTHPERRWLTWVLAVMFALVLLLPTVGLLARGGLPN